MLKGGIVAQTPGTDIETGTQVQILPAKLADQELDEIQSNAYTQAFVEQINDGEPMPTVSEMGQLWSIHTNNIRSMWSGEQTPEEAAKNMVTQLKEAIELMNSGK